MQTITQTLIALVTVGATLIAPSPASGQSVSEHWKGLVPSALQTVYVRDTSGVETTGKLLGLSPDSLTLLVDGVERHVDLAQIARIQKRDSLKNGTIAGAIVGGAMGLLTSGLADCTSGNGRNGCAGFRVALVGFSTGVYAGLGAGIDALIPGRTTIYAAPPRLAPSAKATELGGAHLTMLRVGVSW